jgi:hypothetical protein
VFMNFVIIFILSHEGVAISGVLDWYLGFTDHFNTRILTALKFCAIVNLHTLQIVGTHTLMFSVNSHFLVPASNSGDSSASAFTPLPANHRLRTEISSKLCLIYNPFALTAQKIPLPTSHPLLSVDSLLQRRVCRAVI